MALGVHFLNLAGIDIEVDGAPPNSKAVHCDICIAEVSFHSKHTLVPEFLIRSATTTQVAACLFHNDPPNVKFYNTVKSWFVGTPPNCEDYEAHMRGTYCMLFY